jgi:phospholipid/cholesterol/gamma-HCH transport system substrate-binding protein
VSEYSSSSASYPLNASFRSLEGVSVGTDVRLAGVKVGTVTDVILNPETYRADTTVSLQQGIEIPDDSAIVISSEGLLGGNFVEIVPGGSPFFYAEGDTITDTQGAVSLVSLLMKFVGSGSE